MTRALVWEPWAFDAWMAIEARDPALAERIVTAIEQYVETGRGDVRKLTRGATCADCGSAPGGCCSATSAAGLARSWWSSWRSLTDATPTAKVQSGYPSASGDRTMTVTLPQGTAPDRDTSWLTPGMPMRAG